MNPYEINTPSWEAYEVGYERCLSGAARSECLYTDPDMIEAFQSGYDDMADELANWKDVKDTGKVVDLDFQRLLRNKA